MKPTIILVLAVFTAAPGVSAGMRRGRGSFSLEERGSAPRPRRAVAPQATRSVAPERVEREGGAAPGPRHADVVRDQAFTRGVQSQQRVEAVPGRYYWHTAGGVRYAHYYRGGAHWYGFYHGPSFYWTRYYGSRWWWWDARFGGRWVYWWDGFWWWPGPAGAMYVYVDDGYYPYDPSGAAVVPPAGPAAPAGDSSTSSPDGRRLVRIDGTDGQASLYEKTGSELVYLKFLGRGAAKVRFSGGSQGAALRILIEFRDGGFALFDENGASLDAKAIAQPQGATPPAEPGAAPPPPPGDTQP